MALELHKAQTTLSIASTDLGSNQFNSHGAIVEYEAKQQKMMTEEISEGKGIGPMPPKIISSGPITAAGVAKPQLANSGFVAPKPATQSDQGKNE